MRLWADLLKLDVAPIFQSLASALEDGEVDADEAKALVSTFKGLVGDYGPDDALRPATLFLDEETEIIVAGHRFCFTGTFNYGTRRKCEDVTRDLGAIIDGEIQKQTDYLVVGSKATHSWKHSSFGTKIVRALEWRDAGTDIVIVREDRWLNAIQQKPPTAGARQQKPEGLTKKHSAHTHQATGSADRDAPPRPTRSSANSSFVEFGRRSARQQPPRYRGRVADIAALIADVIKWPPTVLIAFPLAFLLFYFIFRSSQ